MKTLKKNLMAVTAIAAILGLAAFAAPAVASPDDNWQVVKNAVREEARPAAVRGEAKWFKVVITNGHSKEDNLKITLPLSLVEGLAQLAAASEKHHGFHCNGRELDIDVLEILDQLKKAGPLALVEINDGDESIKIWIE
ncbi:MAG: hypothetical protein ACYDH3_05400 [Candidatus Aminicenantales bacterium]